MKFILFSLAAFSLFIAKGQAQMKLSLKESKELALKNNYTIKNGQLVIVASEETKKAAVSAYFPKVDAMGLGVYAFNDFISPIPGILPQGIDNVYAVSASALQPIYMGGKITSSNQLAALQTDVSKTRLSMTTDSVVLETEQRYWQLITLNEQIKTLLVNERYLDTLYKELTDNLKAGLIARNDLMRVKVQRNEITLNKAKLRNARQLASMDFCRFIGIGYDPAMQLTDSVAVISDPKRWHADADSVVKQTSEYKLLESNVRASKLQTELKRADYLPSLAVGVNVSKAGIIDRGIGSTDWTPLAVGTLSIPISGWWGEARHTLKEKKIRENIASNTLLDTESLLKVRIAKAWYDLEEARLRVSLSEDNYKEAELNLRAVHDSYLSGLINLSDLLNAQAAWQASASQVVEAKGNFRSRLTFYRYVTRQLSAAD